MSNNFKWSNELVVALISNVEKYPALYDRSLHQQYNNIKKRTDAYTKVLEVLVLLQPNITLELIKKKWHALRTQFTKELRDIESSKKSGAGTDSSYEPQFRFFLKPHSKTRNSSSNIEKNGRKRMLWFSNEDLEEGELNFTPKRRRKTNSNKKHLLQKKIEKQLIDLKSEIRRNSAWDIQHAIRARVEEEKRNAHSESGFLSLTHTIVHPSSSKDDLVKVPILYVGGAEVFLLIRKSELTERSSSSHSESSSFSSYASSVSSSSKGDVEEARNRSVEGNEELRKSEDREIRPASSQSNVAITSLPKDILQLAMEGVFDPEDFLTDI